MDGAVKGVYISCHIAEDFCSSEMNPKRPSSYADAVTFLWTLFSVFFFLPHGLLSSCPPGNAASVRMYSSPLIFHLHPVALYVVLYKVSA